MSEGASPARIVLHASSLLVLSFLMSANGTVLPQLFYQRHHEGQKVLLLALCLFTATLFATSGVLASRRGGLRRGPALAAVVATLAAESALFVVTSAVAYAALNALAQLGANFLMNHLDQAATARAGAGGRRLADAVGNAARLIGMLAAPAFFTAFHARPGALGGALAAGLALTSASVVSALSRPTQRRAPGVEVAPTTPLPRADRLLFAYVVTIYVALYLFAANMIYLLRDVARIASAERRGGLVIVIVFAGALVSGAVYQAAVGPSRDLRAGALGAPVIPLALAAAALFARAVPSFEVILTGAVIVGASYGVFLAEVRDRASRGGDPRLLTLFNNVGNLSALGAAAAMAMIAATAGSGPVYPRLLALIGGLPIVALPLLFAARSPLARRSP